MKSRQLDCSANIWQVKVKFKLPQKVSNNIKEVSAGAGENVSKISAFRRSMEEVKG